MIAIVCILCLVEIEWGVAMLIKDFDHALSLDEYPCAARCFFRVPISIQERYWQYVVSSCIDEEGVLDASRLFFPLILAMRILTGAFLFSAVGLAILFIIAPLFFFALFLVFSLSGSLLFYLQSDKPEDYTQCRRLWAAYIRWSGSIYLGFQLDGVPRYTYAVSRWVFSRARVENAKQRRAELIRVADESARVSEDQDTRRPLF